MATASAVWILANPLPSYYDEALYAIYALIDVWAYRTYGPAGAWLAMLQVDPSAPPGMRMVALPVILAGGPSLTLLRFLSLAGFFAAAATSAAALRRMAGSVAGALGFATIVALPVLVHSTKMFGTEYPLFLAVALLLLGLASRRTLLLTAASVALGLLSKTSYAVVAAPMLVAVAIVMKDRRRPLAIGAAAGLLISLTWWLHDPMRAIRFGIQSGNFIRHSLGNDYGRYFYELLRCGFGFGAAAALVLAFWGAIRRKSFPRPAIVCLAGALPLMAMHLTSVNHNPRLLAVPVMLIAAAGVLCVPLLPPRQQAAFLTLVVIQVAVMAGSFRKADSYIWRGVSEVMAPVEQWDWRRLHDFALGRGLARPHIAILGEGYAFNAPQVRYGWRELRGAVPVTPLYEWTQRKPFDLRAAVERAAAMDLVVTAPGYRGEETDGQTPNNRYNAAFAEALSRDGRCEGPYGVDVGVREPAVVQVFICRAGRWRRR